MNDQEKIISTNARTSDDRKLRIYLLDRINSPSVTSWVLI